MARPVPARRDPSVARRGAYPGGDERLVTPNAGGLERAARALPVERPGELDMQGCITSRDVLLHPVTIYRLWGPACYLRCLRAVLTGERCTFLGLVTPHRR